MRERENSIPGYRVYGDRPKPDKRFNDDSIRPKTGIWRTLHLQASDPKAEKMANCVNDDRFIQEPLPTDREAQMMCAGCPVFDLCDKAATIERPSWGIYAGRVVGRALDELIGDE